MNDSDLKFPVAKGEHPPPPILTMDQYHAWVMEHWLALSPAERERALKDEWEEHSGVRFSLIDRRAA